MIYKALDVIQIFGADERTDERTDEGVPRGPRGPKKKSQLKDESATAGSAKKEIAKTEKQEATIFPEKVMLQKIFSFWDRQIFTSNEIFTK